MEYEFLNQQLKQDEEYWFPYHYVGQFNKNNFQHYFLDTWAINYVSTIEFLLNKIDTDPGLRIVDIGCGDGRFSRELSIANPSKIVVGIDYSERAVKLAQVMNCDIANLTFKRLDITNEIYPDVFDIAVLMEVFEHIPLDKAEEFMRAVHGLLKRGGILHLTVPHENKPIEYKHFQHFSANKIISYINPYFEIEEVVPFEKISRLRILILKILSNGLFVLSNQRLLSLIYRFYKKNLFFCSSEKECQRLYVKAVAK